MIDKLPYGFINSVYDFNDFTLNELICKLAQKMDEVITQSNESFNYLDWLKGQGLSDEVIKIMIEWKENGTFETIINEQLFNGLNNKIDENKAELDESINVINSQLDTIEKIKKFRYAMFTFEARNLTDNNSKLVILLSNDGIVWENLDMGYISPNLRDPFCFVKDDYYYITATNLVTNSNVTYLRSKDLIHFEEITTPYNGLADYSSIWAPSVFKFNNDYYMTVSLSVYASDIYRMNQYVSKLDSNLIPTTWSKVNILGNATSVYDGHFIATDKKIYMYYKNTQVGYEGIEIACSDTIDGDFNIIGNIETDNRKEAPFLFLVNDKLRLYLDTYEGEGGITHKDMFYDLSYNKPIITKNISKKYKHCHLIDLTGWKWETNYNLESNFINLNDANDLTITYYNRRSVTPSTLNLPSNVAEYDKYGKITLYEQGGGNLSQDLHLLNNRHFYRNYVSGNWSSWSEVLKDGDVTNIVLRPEVSVGGVDINIININGNKIVNIQGNLTNIDKSTTIQNLFTIESKYRTKKNITINAININNWEDKHPLIELKTDGKVNLLIPGGSVLTQSNYVFFNVTYVI